MSVMSYNGAAIIGAALTSIFSLFTLFSFPQFRFSILFFLFARAHRSERSRDLASRDSVAHSRFFFFFFIDRTNSRHTHAAMCGNECVAIASDDRLGINQQQTVAVDFPKLFAIHSRLYLGLAGLATDTKTLASTFEFKHKLYELREQRKMEPKVFAAVVSNALYEKRFGPYYAEPVIAGLDKQNKPYVNCMDLIGAMAPTDNFVVAGNNAESLFGVCESMYRENLEPEELFEVISQCLMSGSGRDCLSGWGGTVHVITKEGVETKKLKGRMD